MKKILSLLFFTLQLLNLYKTEAQTILYKMDSTYKYNEANSEPPSNWYLPNFDDMHWQTGIKIIGFGYPSSSMGVNLNPYSKSLYLRFKFNVSNKNLIKKVNFFADFDDGYIAYLNGKEILRKNISFSHLFPAYNDVTERSHESELFHGTTFPVLGYYLDSLLIDTCFVNGENILAVHVLNDSQIGRAHV
jgi:hypothetical protein